LEPEPDREGWMNIAARKQTVHPHITRRKNICGGRSVVAGTRIPVWSLIKWYKMGMAVEDIIREFPQLTPAQVHDAFSYYYDNLYEVEKDVAENEDEKNLKPMTK
jgi:type III restriction enzyme